jgi:hypothetical protein
MIWTARSLMSAKHYNNPNTGQFSGLIKTISFTANFSSFSELTLNERIMQ